MGKELDLVIEADADLAEIQVEVKIKAFYGGRRVYPGQKIAIASADFNPVVFKKTGAEKAVEGDVKDIKETVKAEGKAEAKKESKSVI